MYIAAMQLFPIKLNFSFIKNADVKVCEACVHAAWWGGQCLSLLSILYLKIIVTTQRLSGRRCYTTPRRSSYLLFKGRSSYALLSKGGKVSLCPPLFRGSLLPQVWRKKKTPLPFPTVEKKAENHRKYNYIVCCTVCSPSREVLTRTLYVFTARNRRGGNMPSSPQRIL